MIKRNFTSIDNKNRLSGTESMWDNYFSNMKFEDYLKTLVYDETTPIINKYLLTQKKNIKIIDIGCGAGRHLAHLHKNGFSNLTGVDISQKGLEIAKKNIPDLKVICADATQLPFNDNEFDLILMVGIIYEIEDQNLHKKLVSEINRVLKKGGLFIFVNNSPYNFGEKLYTRQLNKKQTNKDDLHFFVWRFNKKYLKELLLSSYLSILKTHKCNFGRNLFRFQNGIFVKKSVLENRKKNINIINTYSLHEQYLANKDKNIFNLFGRIIFFFRILFSPVFYNSIVFICKKL